MRHWKLHLPELVDILTCIIISFCFHLSKPSFFYLSKTFFLSAILESLKEDRCKHLHLIYFSEFHIDTKDS